MRPAAPAPTPIAAPATRLHLGGRPFSDLARPRGQDARRAGGDHSADPGFGFVDRDYPPTETETQGPTGYEIHLVRRTSGHYIIGDRVGRFSPGHVSLVGPHLPREWISDVSPGTVVRARDGVVHFDDAWFEKCAAVIPELGQARALLRASHRGIVFGGRTAERAAEEIEGVGRSSGPTRMGHFLALIGLLLGAPESELRFVSHRWLATPASRDEAAALDAGLAYVYANIGGPVTLSEAARRARMSQPTFSKYFRRASGGTFTEVVRTLRIAKARELLTHTTDPIAAICFAAGFSGLTNFNRQFRRETGMTPREYRTASRSAAQHS